MSALRNVFGWLSPAGSRSRLSVLIFHRVLAAHDPLLPDVPDAATFDRTLEWLRTWFNVLPLDDALMRLPEDALPERAAAITFDDGYADNYEVAAPALLKQGLSATFFIATGFLDGECMWNDVVISAVRESRQPELDLRDLGLGIHYLGSFAERRSAIETLLASLKYLPPPERDERCARIVDRARVEAPRDLMMKPSHLVELRRRGMQIGAHTISHPILTRVSDAVARHEIAESKRTLEAIVGERVDLFAYPNGRAHLDFRPVHASIVRECGYKGAVTTERGAASRRTDPMLIPRFTPWDDTRMRFGIRMIGNLAFSGPRSRAMSAKPRHAAV